MPNSGVSTRTVVWCWTRRVALALLGVSLLLLGAMSLVGLVILRRQGDIPPMGDTTRTMGVLAACVVGVFAVWWIPRRQAMATGGELTPRDRAEMADPFRRTLAGLMAGIAMVVLSQQVLRLARSSEAASLRTQFERGMWQLASDDIVSRVAGVHLLEDLARTSKRLRRPVYETLVVFVRERTRSDDAGDSLPLAPEVIAAAAAVMRRPPDDGSVPLRPDFSGAKLRGIVVPGAQLDFSRLRGVQLQRADLHGAHIAGKLGVDLEGAHLDSANLTGAHLDGARLSDGATLVGAILHRADLDGANLSGANLRFVRLDSAELQGATLTGARLDSASLRGALLHGATLRGASLVGTDFAGASFSRVNLAGTDLSAARNLTRAQLATARMDSTTRVPPELADALQGRTR